MKKFNELYICPTCGKEVEALFSSGAVPLGCCSKCFGVAQKQVIDKACSSLGDIEKRGVTVKTIAPAIKEIMK